MKTTIDIMDILRYSRKHESVTEAKYINNYLIPKISELGYRPEMDMAGNIWVETATKAAAPYLFVAHIDTCHRQEGMLSPIVENNIVRMNPIDVSKACLGADDGVGMYVNLRMIEAGVQGTFLFTRGEECGGIGASTIAKSLPHLLEGFLFSLEVDRAGTDEVIASQSYGECASEAFCLQLGKAIGMGHKPSHQGVYTDVSEFASIIPENVNIGAGYYNQHTVKETVNLTYVYKLTEKLINLDYSNLAITREPGDYGTYDNYAYAPADNYANILDYVTAYPERVAHFLDIIGVEEAEMEKEWKADVGYDDYDTSLASGMW